MLEKKLRKLGIMLNKYKKLYEILFVCGLLFISTISCVSTSSAQTKFEVEVEQKTCKHTDNEIFLEFGLESYICKTHINVMRDRSNKECPKHWISTSLWLHYSTSSPCFWCERYFVKLGACDK